MRTRPLRARSIAVLGAVTGALLSGCATFRLAAVSVDGRPAEPAELSEVQVIRDAAPIPIEPGMTLEKGDVIETGRHTTVSIHHGSDTAILASRTRVEILNPRWLAWFGEIFVSGGSDVDANEYGSVLPEHTKYAVRVDPGEHTMRVRVLEGTVRVTPIGDASSAGATVRGGEDVTFDRHRQVLVRRTLSAHEIEDALLFMRQAEPGEKPIVPDLRGLLEAEARARARRLGIRGFTATATPAAPDQVGRVVTQSPAPDRRGDAVEVGVGAESVITPEVTGLSEAEARRAIERAGLTPGRIRQEISDGAGIGRVRTQDPRPGERALPGSEVHLVVEADSVVVPHLVGKTIHQATTDLRAVGLRVERRDVDFQAVGAGIVVLQEYDPGERVAPGSTVWVNVTGPAPIE